MIDEEILAVKAFELEIRRTDMKIDNKSSKRSPTCNILPATTTTLKSNSLKT